MQEFGARFRWLTILSAAVGSAGCCATPTLVAAAKSGPYVHVSSAGEPSHSGLVLPPTAASWPPAAAYAQDAAACRDEARLLETDLGVHSVACPVFQQAATPGTSNADEPISGAGAQLLCYDLGKYLLLVELTQRSTQCNHVVGLALFHKR
jgi:hypothetical protein